MLGLPPISPDWRYCTIPLTYALHVLFMLLGSFSLSVAFRFFRPFFRFQVPFRQGCAGQNRLDLKVFGPKTAMPSG